VLPSDDERMETYLKQFRPLAADALPAPARRRLMRRPLVLGAWALAIMILAAVTLILVHRVRRPAPVPQVVKTSAPAGQNQASPALTLQNANEILARAPSYGAALDGMAFRHFSAEPPAGKKSAFAVLGREDSRL
jgi:hypothetical protein